MKNIKSIMFISLGLLLITACSKGNADQKEADKMRKSLVGTWKITNAKIDRYDRGVLRKNLPADDYVNQEFTINQAGDFTEKKYNETTLLKGKWNVYIVDTEDGGSDAIEEGEDYTTNLFLFYSRDDNSIYDKSTWELHFKKKNKELKVTTETATGIVHLILNKQ